MLNGKAPETPIETLRRLVPKVGAHPLLPAEVRQALTAALGQMEVTERRLQLLEHRCEVLDQAIASKQAQIEMIRHSLVCAVRGCDA